MMGLGINEVAIEFMVVTGSLFLMVVFFIISLVLLLGNNRIWRRTEATFNAGIVFLLLSIGMFVVACLMYMFYPSYFVKVLRSFFMMGMMYLQ